VIVLEIINVSPRSKRKDYVEIVIHHRKYDTGKRITLGSRTVTLRFELDEKVDLDGLRNKIVGAIK
jgi:hypothetical protein